MTTSAGQYRALVVDDEPLVRQALVRALRCENFVCEPAANGREAMEWISEFPYDLVVTDVRMPEHNGHALAVDLLALPHPPVIVVLTGVLEPRIANDLRVRGVDEVLFKPVDFQFLAKRARGLVETRGTDKRNQTLAPSDATANEVTNAEPARSLQKPNHVLSPPSVSEESPLLHANALQSNSTSTASLAKQPDGPAHDQDSLAGQLPKAAESMRVSAIPITEHIELPRVSASVIPPGTSAPVISPSASNAAGCVVADDAIAARVRALADQLQNPPISFDGFAIASKKAFCTAELADAVLRNPALIHDVLRMANGVLFGASQTIRDMQGSAIGAQGHTIQQPTVQQSLVPVVVFALGIGLGWLLSWLGPAVWLR